MRDYNYEVNKEKREEFPIMIPAGLHPETTDMVQWFAQEMAKKLRVAELKYGYADEWRRKDWMEVCKAELIRHIDKGDPRDVAIYCAFLHYHNQTTADAFDAYREHCKKIGKML